MTGERESLSTGVRWWGMEELRERRGREGSTDPE